MKSLLSLVVLGTMGLLLTELKGGTPVELQSIADSLKSVLEKLESQAEFKFSEDSPTLLISYRTKTFQVRPKAPNGGYLPMRDEIGPDSQGFYLRIHLQKKDAGNKLGMKQTLQEQLWATDFDVTPISGTEKRLPGIYRIGREQTQHFWKIFKNS